MQTNLLGRKVKVGKNVVATIVGAGIDDDGDILFLIEIDSNNRLMEGYLGDFTLLPQSAAYEIAVAANKSKKRVPPTS